MFRPMRRFKQQLSREECLELLEKEKRGVLSLLGDEGYPYGVPLDFWYNPQDGCLYFHCAPEGKKLSCIARWPEATLTAAEAGEGDFFSVCYASAVLRGRITVVEDEGEKYEALLAITRRYCPDLMGEADDYLRRRLKDTCVCRLDLREITGKERLKG